MKVRMGFVSNSSSSSFCIYGVFINLDNEKDGYALENKAGDLNLYTSYGPEGCCGIYVGKQWAKIRDDQTGKQFKEEVETKIATLLGKPTECCTHEEGWYNG